MKIYKYNITPASITFYPIPVGAKFLSAGLDLNDRFAIWCLVDPESETEDVKFYFHTTGEDIQCSPEGEPRNHLWTGHYNRLIMHVFSRDLSK